MLPISRLFTPVGLILLLSTTPAPAQHAGGDGEYFLGVPLTTAERAGDPSVPPGYFVEEVASGFVWPTAIAFTPDGRILVAEKRGIVWIVEDGERLPEPFIDLTDEVMTHHDRGLLGLTVHPEYDETGHVYLLYTVDHDGTGSYARYDVFSRLTRYTASADDPNVADLDSRHVLIGETFSEGWPACYFSHVIGTVQFGSDGTLLVGSGEAASFSEIDAGGLYPPCFGPDRIDPVEDIGAFRSLYAGSLAGKILRIDAETGLGLPSNPFFTGDPSDVESRTWVSGLRNPFRFSIGTDGESGPALGKPGTLYIGDVGHSTWEELNVAYGGENFGWPCYEGLHPHPGYQAAEPPHSGCATVADDEYSGPTYYWHQWIEGDSYPPGLSAASIVVGDIYRGTKYPEDAQGALWYADYVRGWMAYTTPVGPGGLASDHTVFSLDTGWVVDLRYDSQSGYLHYVNIHTGRVMRIGYDPTLGGPTPEAAESRLRIAELFPNPMSGAGELQLVVTHPGVHLVEIVDLLGRVAWEMEVEAHAPGRSAIPLRLDGLPSAVYFVRVSAPDGQSDTVRFTVVR